jgi:hypothetical protein
MHMTKKRSVLFMLATAFAAILALPYIGDGVDAQATVTVTGYTASHSSVKVFYRPVPGAQDYRVYDVSAPTAVKYAGLTRLVPSATCPGEYCDKHFVTQSDGSAVFPYQIANGRTGGLEVIDGPATQIDWNNVGDGAVHTLIVEAVNMLGPVPPGSLYTGEYNTPLLAQPAGSMVGGNKGPTPDGKLSTNGQGPYTNNPQVIARSAPFTVQVDRSFTALPSKGSATQVFFDTFETAENMTIVQTARNDGTIDSFSNIGWMKYTMNAGTPRAWDIEYRQADNNNSMPFVSADHFMDMLFDGGTSGTGAPGHQNVASMSMTPTKTLDLSGGKILHLTMEVDGHMSNRKWVGFNLAPASDPLQAWHPSGGVRTNTTNRSVFMELFDSQCALDIYNGTGANNAPTGTASGTGGPSAWGFDKCNGWTMYVPGNLGRNGLGFDDKSRYDFFISQTRAALFQDGHLIIQAAIPPGSFPWFSSEPIRAYFTHYVYHTTNDVDELQHGTVFGAPNCYPMNAYWFNDPSNGTRANETSCNRAYPPGFGFRYSAERHWDNMGFEVLPASEMPASDYSGFAASVRLPAVRPAQPNTNPVPTAPANLRVIQ